MEAVSAAKLDSDIRYYDEKVLSNNDMENKIICICMSTQSEMLKKGIKNYAPYKNAIVNGDSYDVYEACKQFSESSSNVTNVLERSIKWMNLKQDSSLEEFTTKVFDGEMTFIRDMEDPLVPGYTKTTNITAAIFLGGLDVVEFEFMLREQKAKLNTPRIDNVVELARLFQEYKNSVGTSAKDKIDPGALLGLAAINPRPANKRKFRSSSADQELEDNENAGQPSHCAVCRESF